MSKAYVCENCESVFTPKDKGKPNRFCSQPCYWASMRGSRESPPRKCLYCGTKFFGAKTQKYCSHKCYTDSRKKPGSVRTCEACDEEFVVKRKRRSDGYRSGIYCSNECRQKARRARTVAECETCGGSFETLANNPEKYCSHECYWESLRNGVTFECDECGQEAYRSKAVFESTNNHFCSNECAKAYLSGEKHPQYRHGTAYMPRGSNWHSQRKKAIRRDKQACQHCGTHKRNLSPSQWRLEVHHKIPFCLFETPEASNVLSNLVTLCHTCHVEADRQNRVTYERELAEKRAA